MNVHVARAIAIVEDSRRTHVEWLAHLGEHPGCPDAEIAGDENHHREAVANYDHVLIVLKERANT